MPVARRWVMYDGKFADVGFFSTFKLVKSYTSFLMDGLWRLGL
jgi:hypothetical protein